MHQNPSQPLRTKKTTCPQLRSSMPQKRVFSRSHLVSRPKTHLSRSSSPSSRLWSRSNTSASTKTNCVVYPQASLTSTTCSPDSKRATSSSSQRDQVWVRRRLRSISRAMSHSRVSQLVYFHLR